jgi:glycosyltransferase involved in cell wall biosynthesis
VPVEATRVSADRQPEVVAYAGWMWKRGIDILCAAWAIAAPERVRLVIGGADRAAGVAWLDRCGVPEPRGVEWAGAVPHDEWLARVARARAFVNASRREDHGLAQLEALAAGTPLVTVPSPGAYEALPIARKLAPELVATGVSAPPLADAIRTALALKIRTSYAERAAVAMAPYRRDAVLATVRDEVAPALGLG